MFLTWRNVLFGHNGIRTSCRKALEKDITMSEQTILLPVKQPASQAASQSACKLVSKLARQPATRLASQSVSQSVSQSSCQSNSQPVDPSVSLSLYQKLNDLHELQEDRPCANSHLDSVYSCARTGTQAHTNHHPQ